MGSKNLVLCEAHFDIFSGQKSRFLDFWEIVLELFGSCLGIIFDRLRSNFWYIFDSIGWYMDSKIEILGKF